MNQIELKNYKRGDLIVILIALSFCVLFFANLCVASILENREQPSMWNTPILLVVLIDVPLLILLCWFVKDSRKSVLVTQDGVTYLSGNRILQAVNKEDIITYGCFNTDIKYSTGSMFFCFAPVEDIVSCAKKNWHRRNRLYRKKQLQELEKTPEGIWILQMSVYLLVQSFRCGRVDGVIGVNHMSKEELRAIRQLWQKKPMLLGTAARYPHDYL